MRFICTSIVATLMLASTGIAWADDAVQWTEADGGNGHWYGQLDDSLVWPEAKAAAMASGATLMTVTSFDEFQFLTDESGLDIHNRFGGGYQDLDAPDYDEPFGGWRWVTGEVFDWDVMELFMNADDCPAGTDGTQNSLIVCCVDVGNPQLDDIADGIVEGCGSAPRKSIIEWSADCNGDGIVDYGQILDGTYADDDGNGVPDICEAVQAVQWTEAEGGNGHWYEEVLEPGISWGNASDSCISVGGHLATVTSAEENLFIAGISNADEQGDYGIWLGGFQDETSPDYSEPGGGWTWVTNEPWSYESWNQNDCHPSNQPDNANQAESVLDYFCGSVDALYWSDDGPEWPHSSGYLIEWSADCNGDGIVDYGQILDGTFLDTDGNGVPDCCDVPGGCDDCNDNGVLDSEDVADGTSEDCNANGVPDECDTADGTSSDCNVNSIPDECETLADCDGDGTSDACELLAGAIDTNPADGIPDECQGSPSGACCFGSQCVRVTLANCSSSGGEYFGDGSSCADSPCGPSGTGACCLNGACISATLGDCFVAGGSFAGALAGCSDVSCPVECTGDANYDGVVDIEDLLNMLGSWGACP